jgi:hypothetical protein
MKRDRVLDKLNRHGTMPAPTTTMLAPPAKSEIRKWLGVRRKTVSADEESLIWQALFRLYGIPDEWPREFRLEWLARRLASELFPRCQALAKPRSGGPSKSYLAAKTTVLESFQHFWSASHLSRVRAAELFMQDAENNEACKQAGFTKPKSLSQALYDFVRRTTK